jgi:hypothetical protein
VLLPRGIDSHACSLEATMNSVTLLNGLKALEDAIDSHACSLEALPCVWPMSFLSGIHSSYHLASTLHTIYHGTSLKGTDCRLCEC